MKKRTGKDFIKIFNILYKHSGSQHWWPARSRFEMMIGALLTQNTAWTNVTKALNNLKTHRTFTPTSLYDITPAKLCRLVKPAGYFNQKTRYLKSMIFYLKARWNFNLNKMFRTPLYDLRVELLSVKGMGPETVDSILLYAGNYPIFVIDAYTKRIFSRHRFCAKDISYHELQEKFMNGLPKNYKLFNEYHALIVNIGKNFCHNRNPECNRCPLIDDPHSET